MKASAEVRIATRSSRTVVSPLNSRKVIRAILGIPTIFAKGTGVIFTEQLKEAERFSAIQVSKVGVMLMAPWDGSEKHSYSGQALETLLLPVSSYSGGMCFLEGDRGGQI